MAEINNGIIEPIEFRPYIHLEKIDNVDSHLQCSIVLRIPENYDVDLDKISSSLISTDEDPDEVDREIKIPIVGEEPSSEWKIVYCERNVEVAARIKLTVLVYHAAEEKGKNKVLYEDGCFPR